MRRRLASLGRGFTVRQSGAARHRRHRARRPPRPSRRGSSQLITQPARLLFYDWEANVLTPNGKTVASQLLTQDQHRAGDEPGRGRRARHARRGRDAPLSGGQVGRQAASGAGGQDRSRARARRTTSSARRAARRARRRPSSTGRRRQCRVSTACSRARTGESSADRCTAAQLPTGVTKAQGQRPRRSPRARSSLQAEPTPSASRQIAPNSPAAQFFVLQRQRRADGHRHHPPAAGHRPVRPARRHVRVQRRSAGRRSSE